MGIILNIDDQKDELPKPWHRNNSDLFEKQLQIEISDSHILKGKKLKILANSRMRDEVLFEIIGEDEYKYAIVHLTWSEKKESYSYLPDTDLYKNWDDVYKIIMDDHNDYMSEDF